MRKQMKRKEGLVERIMKGIMNLSKRKLFKNKVCSTFIMLIGYASIRLLGDCTFFVFTLMLALPVFFARENVIQ